MAPALGKLEEQIVACRKCARLAAWREEVAATKRRAFRDQDYWGKPVPAFGDPAARLVVIGLAPAAHGANRTGRMFTGDRSGDFLYRALYAAGFASQPTSERRGDGLTLRDAWITAAVRCAPPDNKPVPGEVRNCTPYLERELKLLPNVRAIVALGRLAFNVYLSILRDHGSIASRAAFVFGHNLLHATAPGEPALISSYHPSQQNTQTGRLTAAMLEDVFLRARDLLEAAVPAQGAAPRRSSDD